MRVSGLLPRSSGRTAWNVAALFTIRNSQFSARSASLSRRYNPSMHTLFALLLTLVAAASPAGAQRGGAKPPAKPAAPPAPFTTTLTIQEMTAKQAVVNTTAGAFVIDLRPDLAPNHVGYFIKLAREGAFNGTTFHRVVRLVIIQGGDPLSKDPAKAKLYGTGGLGVLKAEIQSRSRRRGAPSRPCCCRIVPTAPGAQFFVCVTDQPRARRQVHGLRSRVRRHRRRAEDLRGAGRWRGTPARRGSRSRRSRFATRRRRSRSRSRTETAAELARYRAVLETTAGPITIEFLPDKAPEHVRNFLRARAIGRLRRHRVPPRRPRLRRPDRMARQPRSADGETAEARADAAAGVQRHEAREGHPLDGARRRSRERHHVLLHRDGEMRARSTGSTRCSAALSMAWPRSTPSSRRR